jgi:uncharacterized membrane protein YdbT with pleckstrin-like domain
MQVVPYPKRLLLDGETVAQDLRPHWWFFAGPLAAGVSVLVLIVLASRLDGDAARAAWVMVFIAAVVWALWLAARLARWVTTHFVVTSDRLIYRTGVLAKHGRDIPLERINDITSNRTFFERLIGAGDLLIESAGERGQQTFSDIAHPDRVQREIYQQMEANAAQVPGPPAAGPSVTDQISALADLRDRGAISNAEYEAKKAQLLDRL